MVVRLHLRQRLRLIEMRRTADKTLFRLPSPFYRDTTGRIRFPAGTVEQITFVSLKVESFVHDEMVAQAKIVRGYLVQRANNGLFAYHIQENKRSAPNEYAFDTLNQQVVRQEDEGSLWARGWDDETRAAMSAALVMA